MLKKILGPVDPQLFWRAAAVFAVAGAVLVGGLSLGDNLVAFATGSAVASSIMLVLLVAASLFIQKKGMPVITGQKPSWLSLVMIDLAAFFGAYIPSIIISFILFFLPGQALIVGLAQWAGFSFLAALIMLRWPKADGQSDHDDEEELELLS